MRPPGWPKSTLSLWGSRSTSRSCRPTLAAHRPAAEYYQLAVDYGITIQDDWIEELERTYGVKL